MGRLWRTLGSHAAFYSSVFIAPWEPSAGGWGTSTLRTHPSRITVFLRGRDGRSKEIVNFLSKSKERWALLPPWESPFGSNPAPRDPALDLRRRFAVWALKRSVRPARPSATCAALGAGRGTFGTVGTSYLGAKSLVEMFRVTCHLLDGGWDIGLRGDRPCRRR